MSRYLVDLADVLRAAGCRVVEYGGWQTRARGSGGFAEGRPWCVMWHHTASQSPADADAAYIAEGSPDAPLANLYIARDGAVWVIAAGATNTNGKGYAMTFSRGTVPNDQMNTHAVGIEIANDGIGEDYAGAQLDAAFAASIAVCAAYGLAADDVGTHVAYAPDRKIDPATADAALGFSPRAINASGSWNLDDLRAECWNRAGRPPTPPTPEPTPPVPAPPLTMEDSPMIAALDENGTIWVGDGTTRRPLADMGVFSNYVVLGLAGCYRFVNTNGDTIRELGHVHTVAGVTLEALGRDDR